MRESMCDTQSKMASDSSNEGTTDKPVGLGNGRRENGENYQRALTLLNEASLYNHRMTKAIIKWQTDIIARQEVMIG